MSGLKEVTTVTPVSIGEIAGSTLTYNTLVYTGTGTADTLILKNTDSKYPMEVIRIGPMTAAVESTTVKFPDGSSKYAIYEWGTYPADGLAPLAVDVSDDLASLPPIGTSSLVGLYSSAVDTVPVVRIILMPGDSIVETSTVFLISQNITLAFRLINDVEVVNA